MKHKIKYITWFIAIFIIFITINSFLFWNKNTTIIKNNAVFDIISETNISIENSIDLEWKVEDYKNIENINIIWKWFFINNSWEFLTAKHLFINKNSKFYIKIDNRKYRFNIIKKYKNKDIVLWKIESYENKYFLNINRTKHDYLIYEDLKIFTYNNKKIINWIITWLSEKIEKLGLNNLIKTNIKLSPWDSWSPLLNERNIVIWVFIAIKSWEDISYAENIE